MTSHKGTTDARYAILLCFAAGCLLLLAIPAPVAAQRHPTDRELDEYERLLESLRDSASMEMSVSVPAADLRQSPGLPGQLRDRLGSERETPRVVAPDLPQVRPRPALSPDSNVRLGRADDTALSHEMDRTGESHGGSIIRQPYRFPWSAVVKLHATDLDGQSWICSASVIGEFHLLTAAPIRRGDRHVKIVMRFGDRRLLSSVPGHTAGRRSGARTAGHCASRSRQRSSWKRTRCRAFDPGWDGHDRGRRWRNPSYGLAKSVIALRSTTFWTEREYYEYDVAEIQLTRAVGMLTGWLGWSWGGQLFRE